MSYTTAGQTTTLSPLERARLRGRLSGSGSSGRVADGRVGSSAREDSADHIVWGAVESSTGSIESSSLTEIRTSKQHLIEDVLLMGSDNSFSEHPSELQRSFNSEHLQRSFNSKDAETKHEHKAALQIKQMSENGRQITNLDDVMAEEEDYLDPDQGCIQQLGPVQAKQFLMNQGMDVEDLVAQVPRNERGYPTSIGSIGHYSQRCKPVCPFIHRPKGCANGIYCNCCHFSHGLRKRKVKDGKSKRDRYRRLKEDMMHQIEAAPDDFQFDSSRLPDCIAKDERLKGKLMNRLRLHQDEVKKKLVEL